MASVGFKAVYKSYGDQEIIHGVDCEIDDGEFIVVVGPSGCGKSTLLRMVAGLETVTGGEIFIGGRSVNALEPAERDIAMVFQNYALYPHMSVFDNMAYGLKIRRLSKAEIGERVKKAADILELTPDILARKPSQLSGGQRQRVAMGRAIVREPAVFLFDEPLSNLDAKLRVQMRLEIKKLQRDLGVTSIYVTHDQIEAMTLGHRLMVLNAGNVEQVGTPIELYERPATVFVAGFIGSPSMNFVSAQIGAAGKTVDIAGAETLSLADDRFASAAGRPVNLGIRPEHFHVVEESTATMHVVTELVEHLGADTLAHGHIGDGKMALTIRLQGIREIKAGERLPLRVEPAALHLFDQATGARLDV